MAEQPKLNGTNEGRDGLPATESEPHPGNFPLGSIESRAAARAMIRPGKLRDGDTGYTEDGLYYVVSRDPVTGNMVQLVIDIAKL